MAVAVNECAGARPRQAIFSRSVTACEFLCARLALCADGALAQAYPTKPIRIVATEAGSSGDLTARLVAQGASSALLQPVIIENRPARMIGVIVSRAAPDGYTIFLSGSTVWIDPLIRSDAAWDARRDFSPITLATSSPLVVVLHPSVAAASVKELIALAKSRPGQLNYGSGASGSASHLGPELFKAMAGVDIVRIPYKGLQGGGACIEWTDRRLDTIDDSQRGLGNAAPQVRQTKSAGGYHRAALDPAAGPAHGCRDIGHIRPRQNTRGHYQPAQQGNRAGSAPA